MEHWKGMLAGVLMILVASCSSTGGNRTLQAEQIFADGLCLRTDTDPAARWIGDAEELEMIRQALGDYRLGPPEFPDVDFDEEGVLWVEMGKRTTSGYGLVLSKEEVRVRDGIAKITLDWRQPGEDMLTAQVLTSPCAMFTLPKTGFQRIDIYDREGDKRLSVEPD